MAMIAKQGWRLLTEANKLVSAVMKARYYSDSSVLNVKLGSNPSYVWRGIYQALEVVRAGARRKIGDGEDTMVWKVPWLPDDSHGFIATDEYPQLKNIKVSSLMSADKSWDVDLLNDLFCDRDVDLITRIPIPLRDTRDSWYWLLVEKGEFTVRSSYRWLHGECTDSYTALWKKLWHLQLPNKISNLVWRLCKGCLPTPMALASKHVDIDVRCPWCHSEIETDVHIMFLCDFARTEWLTTRVNHLVQCKMNESPCQIFTRAFENGTREQCVEIAMICWSLRNRMNRWVWERINGSVFGVRHSAINFLAEWKEAQVRDEDRRLRGELGRRVWCPPKEGWVKINIDAAVFLDGSIGVGAVIRDSQTKFVIARGRKIAGAWRPREAEAMALIEALSWVMAKGYNHCVFDTDSYELATACNGRPGEAYFGNIVMDCIHMLKHICPVLVDFDYRSANSVAHVLA